MRVKLKDIFDLQMGKTPSRSNLEYWNTTDYKWISIADLTKTSKYIFETKEYLSKSAIKDSGIKVIPANTVVMSFKLSIGKTAITKEDMYSNEAIMAFKDKHVINIIPEYIFYLFKYKNWEECSNKAVMGKTLNKATLSEIEVEICSIEKQRQIVNILDKIMSAVDGRKQELQLLDELIKARFVELFGDPDNNEKSWDIDKMEHLCEVGSSKRIYQNEQSMEGVPFLRISDLVNRIDTGSKKCDLYIPIEKLAELKEQGLVPRPGDILLTARGTLGRCYIVQSDDEFYFQDGMITWLSNYDRRITALYISYLFEMPGFRKQIDELQAGSTVAYMSISMTKKLNIMVPPIELQNQFADFVKQVDKSKFDTMTFAPIYDIINLYLHTHFYQGRR